MTGERWHQVEELFAAALEHPLPERERFLDQFCGEDRDLKREVVSLLACDAPDERLLEIPPFLSADGSNDREAAVIGRRIGPYRVRSLIGRGGMGAVYLAVRDDDQYQKQVAIKLLNRGMDTGYMLSRFRQERQILANLEHPFIARLLDGGATEEGLPYFVMEYVEGVPITDFCARGGLSLHERLRLFRLVCEAVQYAHQHLVVHRDIKPGNILTTKEGVPKLLDFGIAKVLEPGASPAAALTRSELRMFTPDYASPEQVRGLPVSTATDIYSLGAVLYELLTGQRPHRFHSEAPADLDHAICEVEPVKPSMAGGSELSSQLSGDLDNIVLAAMRKEPQRRYASAAELSEDVRRHIECLPVLAREDRWSYRLWKFVRRNRMAVIAAMLISASLVGVTVVALLQAGRAERRFELARQLANAVVADIEGPLEQLPGSTATRAQMIQTVLRYLDGLAREPGKDPAFELEMADTYRQIADVEGNPYRPNLGRSAAALEHLQKAMAIYERLAAPAGTEARALAGLIATSVAASDIEARSGNIAAAETRLEKASAIAHRNRARLVPQTEVLLHTRLGDAKLRTGDVHSALAIYRRAVDVAVRWAGSDRGMEARNAPFVSYVRLGLAELDSGDLYGALRSFEESLRWAEAVSRQSAATAYEHATVAGAHRLLANVLGNPDNLNLGDRPQAILHARAAIRIGERLAATDPRDVRIREGLATAYRSMGVILLEENPEEALMSLQKAGAISQHLNAGQPASAKLRHDAAVDQMLTGECLHRLHRDREAIQRLEAALDVAKSLTATSRLDQIPPASLVARLHRDIGGILVERGDHDEAYSNYSKAVALSEEAAQRNPSSMKLSREYADSLESMGRYYATVAAHKPNLTQQSRAWFQKSLDIWRSLKARNVAEPYATTRQLQVAALIAKP